MLLFWRHEAEDPSSLHTTIVVSEIIDFQLSESGIYSLHVDVSGSLYVLTPFAACEVPEIGLSGRISALK